MDGCLISCASAAEITQYIYRGWQTEDVLPHSSVLALARAEAVVTSSQLIDASMGFSYRPPQFMNAKLFFKTVFLIAILFLLVLMGMHNKQIVEFSMPSWILPKVQKQPAAVMYFAFFAVGVLSGTILTAGGGKKGAASKPSKSDK